MSLVLNGECLITDLHLNCLTIIQKLKINIYKLLRQKEILRELIFMVLMQVVSKIKVLKQLLQLELLEEINSHGIQVLTFHKTKIKLKKSQLS
ncbi:hypothetical protein D3C85_1238360 [compost metagenome]